jgi:hypothetical protein
MRKLIWVAGFIAAFAVPQYANAGTYQDAMRQCGTEWRASEARKAVKKGEGAAAWNAFRAECTKRVGWEKKARGSTAKKAD